MKMTKGNKSEPAAEVVFQHYSIPVIHRPKLSGFQFYEKTLGSPKFVVAPMVDASELAWRILCRRHGADLCYTPMYHSNCFVKDIKYRNDALQSCPEDRPLILQFCGNDPKIILQAALLAQDHCDAIDINLGCPQAIAKRGHYGAFLQDEWDLLQKIVSTLSEQLSVPVTCKIRVFEDIEKTIKYAQMLEKAGAQLLTVHGRTREMKGPMTGIADWTYIKKVRESVSIPVFANGNICCIRDVERCLAETRVNGVMSAEGNLQNPFMFEGRSPTVWNVAYEYLDILEQYPAPRSYIRGHLFKIFHHLLSLKSNAHMRTKMAISGDNDEFREIAKYLREKYEPFHEGYSTWDGEPDENHVPDYNLTIPPWICQPYYRIPPEEHIQKMEECQKLAEKCEKRKYFDDDGNAISKKHMKKLKKISKKLRNNEEKNRHEEICIFEKCSNTKGLKCEYQLCRSCCKEKCYNSELNCIGHKVHIKDKREKARHYEKMKTNNSFE